MRLSDKELNRTTVKITGGISRKPVRFPAALALVVEGRAEWVNHPVDDYGKKPEIRIIDNDKTRKAMGYDAVRRSNRAWATERIPFTAPVDRMLGGKPKGDWAWRTAVRPNHAFEVNGTSRKETACSAR